MNADQTPAYRQISEWTVTECARFIAADRLSRLPWPKRYSKQVSRLVRAVAGFPEPDASAKSDGSS